MDESAITIIPTEVLISQAIETIKRGKNAADLVILHPWTHQLTDRIASSAARHFHLDKDDLATFITEKIRSEIHTLSNPNHRPWCDCLDAWLTKITHNHCINVQKHLTVERKHEEVVQRFSTKSRRNSVPIFDSSVTTPEEQMLKKEEERVWKSRLLETRDFVRSIITSFPPEYVRIAYLWGIGQTPKQIADLTNDPLKTVYGRLERTQKAVIKAIAIDQTTDNKMMVKKGLRQMFASSLHGIF